MLAVSWASGTGEDACGHITLIRQQGSDYPSDIMQHFCVKSSRRLLPSLRSRSQRMWIYWHSKDLHHRRLVARAFRQRGHAV